MSFQDNNGLNINYNKMTIESNDNSNQQNLLKKD